MSLKNREIQKRYTNTGFMATEAVSLILAFVFAYTAIAKVYDWNATKLAMYNQVIPDWSKDLLLYGIPMMEVVVALMLFIPRWRYRGFLVSLMLMLAFTGYVAWIWFGLAGRVPCSCGGIISSLTWGEHLVLNLGLTGLSVWGVGCMGVGRYGSMGE